MDREKLYVGVSSAEWPERAIAWTLDFMNLDLTSLGKQEQWKTALELGQYLTVRLSGDGTTPAPDLDVSLPEVQRGIRDFFNRSVKPALEQEELNKLPPDGCDVFSPSWKNGFFYRQGNRLMFASYASTDPIKDAVEQFKEALILASPLDVTVFRKCEGCGNYFFQEHRKKRFCTRLCNLRYNAKKRRGEKGSKQREEYNKLQKDLMKKRYREKKKKELGNKIKVGR